MPLPSRLPPHGQDHYSVLGLASHIGWIPSPEASRTSTKVTKLDIKQAYHRALLSHHPDKKNTSSTGTGQLDFASSRASSRITVDDIVRAYKVLIDEESKAQYDRVLASESARWTGAHDPTGSGDQSNVDQSHGGRNKHDTRAQNHGGEIIYRSLDLDDMVYEESEEEQTWSTACRCGLSKGYTITEQDLDRGARDGENEAWIQCLGCSLWIVVAFEATVDEKQGNETDLRSAAHN